MTPVIDRDLDPRFMQHLAAAPPGVVVLFAGRDRDFACAMRAIFHVTGDIDTVLIAVHGKRTWACIPNGLIVTFTSGAEDEDDIDVVPALMTDAPWLPRTWPREGFAQPSIDAVEALLLRRCEPTGRVQ